MSFLPLVGLGAWSQHGRVFSAHCPVHGRRVLLGPDDIVAVSNDPEGVHVDWRCPCGGRGRLLTGRRAATPCMGLPTDAQKAPGNGGELTALRGSAGGG